MSIIMDLFRRSQKERQENLDPEGFWEIINCIDHEYGGDSEAVISSIVRHLKNCGDEYIFAFDDMVSELIYGLDGREYAEGLFEGEEFAEEKFLSARCAAIAMGAEHYDDVKNHRRKLSGENIHEYKGRWYGVTDGLMTAAADAWSRKHLDEVKNYPHKPRYCVASHSNSEMWE